MYTFRRKVFGILAVPFFLGLISCSGNKNKDTSADEQTDSVGNEMADAVSFDADSAYSFVDRQVSFGPRVPGSRAWDSCSSWLVSKLNQYADVVEVQKSVQKTFDGKQIPCHNIIASINPSAQTRVLLAAHWDSRPFSDQDPNKGNHDMPILGADDGASGAGILIELARQWKLSKPSVGVDLILFDAEDYGSSNSDSSWCLGSTYWAKNPHIKGYSAKYGILLDMVGSKDATFYWEGFSKDNAPALVSSIWEMAARLGYGRYFVQANGGYLTDDHVPIIKNMRIPMVDIVNYNPNNEKGFGDYWHTQRDNMNIISAETLQVVGRVVKAVVDNEK